MKAKLAAARVALTQSEQVDADEDSTAVMQRMTRAEEDVCDTEKELAVAIRKDEAAQTDLLHAERQASDAGDDEVLAAFKDSILELEAVMGGELKRTADKVGAMFAVVKDRSGGDPGVASSLRDFLLWFPVYRDRDCAALIPSGRAYSKTLDEDKKPLSAWADNVSYAMKQRKGR